MKAQRIIPIGVICTFFLSITITVFGGQWQQDANGWRWIYENGTFPKDCWKWCDGNGDGTAECFYFDTNGYCLRGTTTPDGYSVNNNGEWIVSGVVQRRADTEKLDELASKLKTFEEVEKYWQNTGFGAADPGYDHHFEYKGREWSVNKNATAVFDNNTGNCGGTANLLNYLLQGDYADMGYIYRRDETGGHIISYFLDKNGIYHILDQTGLRGNRRRFENHVTGATLQEAGTNYINQLNQEWKNATNPLVVRSLYAIRSLNGDAHAPISTYPVSHGEEEGYFPKSYKDSVIELYVKDNNPKNRMIFADYDIPVSAYPANIGY